MNLLTVSPLDDVLSTLREGASARKQKSLELIHDICKEQHERGSADFSIATIGRLSEARGGPSVQPIRNKAGADYRALIEAWAKFSAAGGRKASAKAQAPSEGGELLGAIPDAVVRSLVGSKLRELTKLRAEVNLLKKTASHNLVIDMRARETSLAASGAVQVVAPLDFLLKTELDALRHALSPELLNKMGWAIEQAGQIVTKSEDRRVIFKPGFATAIKKILDASSK